mmetsp:Transcript_25618/g.47098  ORF Transcript_25618/g.47098 Transcript_25618/m.47098 type:complete len:93 (-) Transcript_25618:1175-1453(-)
MIEVLLCYDPFDQTFPYQKIAFQCKIIKNPSPLPKLTCTKFHFLILLRSFSALAFSLINSKSVGQFGVEQHRRLVRPTSCYIADGVSPSPQH